MQADNDSWREKLTPAQYQVLRQCGTEAPFSGEYLHCTDDGIYRCAACGAALFSSDAKFESGTGWPSFSDAAEQGAHVELRVDDTHGMLRIEAVCRECQSHLGHVFEDGPSPTSRKHYCINSAALKLDRTTKESAQ